MEPETLERCLTGIWSAFLVWTAPQAAVRDALNLIAKSVRRIAAGREELRNFWAKWEKRKYRQMEARAKALPKDYAFVYHKIQHYMWNFAGGDGMGMIPILADLLDLFEAGAADGKPVLEITGADVAEFCDELLRNTKTWTANWHEALNRDIAISLGKGREPK